MQRKYRTEAAVAAVAMCLNEFQTHKSNGILFISKLIINSYLPKSGFKYYYFHLFSVYSLAVHSLTFDICIHRTDAKIVQTIINNFSKFIISFDDVNCWYRCSTLVVTV